VDTRAELAAAIGQAIGARLQPTPGARVHGGSINECHCWQSDAGPLFVKVAPARRHAMFEAEAAGLEELRRARAVRVPQVMGIAHTANEVALALEWIELGSASANSESKLAEQLATQHRVRAEAFGWHRDNTIGSNPQHNAWCSDWVSFLRERRLRPQLDLARANGFEGRLQERGRELLARLDRFFPRSPEPSLLHGDLWGGNWAVDERGAPVIFDPAVYFGDRVADIAMTRLFGGFGPRFYAAYEACWPLPSDAEVRIVLYNLYHVLNHLNLFGSSYLSQALASIDRLLDERGEQRVTEP
jgi:protein-ribulosamine 3-kinase